MKNILRFIFLVTAFTFIDNVEGQTYSPQQIQLADRIENNAINVQPEIAYIQTSKDIYETGEDLWFKIYILDAQLMVPSLRSKTLYLQMLNEISGKIVWQEKYEIQNGFTDGKIYLDVNLPDGYYLIEVFTPNTLVNNSEDFKSKKRIKIITDITLLDSANICRPLKSKRIQFSLFPEGGNLISQIQSQLAFKAVSSNGEPVDVRGFLYEDNIPITEFKSIHDGMGSLKFIPINGRKYSIRLNSPSIDSTFFLPEIYPEGISLQLIARDEDFLTFKVTQSEELMSDTIYLRVQCRGIVYGIKQAKLNRELRIKVPLSSLPQGIAEVTLFNSNLIPLAERLIYINQNRKLTIITELSKEILPVRDKAVLKIYVKDEKGKPVIANLGISVFDKIYQNPLDANILSYCYLSSQVKGRIFNPSYYFNNKNKDKEEAIDLLLLTQGWRRYMWSEENLNSNYKQKPNISDGITGQLYVDGKKNKFPSDQTFIMISSPDVDTTSILIPADSYGNFNITLEKLKFWKNSYVYLKPFGPHRSNLKIKLQDAFENFNLKIKAKDEIYSLYNFNLEKEQVQERLGTRPDFITIKEITIKSQKSKSYRGKYMGTLDSLSKLDLSEFTGIEDYICRYGVWNCVNHPKSEPGTTKPIEGKWYQDNNLIYHLAKYKHPIQNLSEEELLKKFNLTRVKSYYTNKGFYKPNYDKDTIDSRIPDFRNTLLWEPSIFTNEKGEATVNFFCSDIYTDFVGRIEGVGGDGLLGAQYFTFKVRKLNIKP